MEFNTEDRMDIDIDMDEEYDMVPMPMYMQEGMPGMEQPGMMEMTPEMMGFPGMMGVPGMMEMTPEMMGVPGVMGVPGMMPGAMGVPGLMPWTMPPGIPEGMPGMMYGPMGTEEMMPRNFSGMNMMEMEEDEYSNREDDSNDDMRKEKDYGPLEINRILMKIERYNPGIFRYLRMYGMSYKAARRFIKKIIKLTLMYYED